VPSGASIHVLPPRRPGMHDSAGGRRSSTSGIPAAQESQAALTSGWPASGISRPAEDSQLAGVVAVDEDRLAEAELLGDSLSGQPRRLAHRRSLEGVAVATLLIGDTRNTRTSTL